MASRTIWMSFLLPLTFVPAVAQVPPYKVTSLLVRPQGDSYLWWKIRRAEIDEGFSGTMGVLEIENISADPVDDVRLYAEYLDASGRLCFTLIFAADRNFERKTRAFQPGEVRMLYASAHYLDPATRPSEVKVYAVRQAVEGNETGTGEAHLTVRSPALLLGSTLTGEQWEKVWLEPDLEGGRGPFLDLLLARVRLGREGEPQEAEVLTAVTASVQSWFDHFIRNQRFQPPKRGGVGEPGSTLLLVRAAVSLRCIHQTAFPPRESSVVKNYVRGVSGPEVPPVNTLFLQPSSPDYWKQPSPGYFGYVAAGSDWSAMEVSDNSDAGKHLPLGPPLRRIDAPPGSDACP